MRREITDIRRWDILPAVAVFALAFVLFFVGIGRSSDAQTVIIKTDAGEASFTLTEDRTIDIQSSGHKLTVVISDGEAGVTESDCPDKVCVNSKPITKDGGTIVCVPAKVIIKAEGGDGDGIDWTAP